MTEQLTQEDKQNIDTILDYIESKNMVEIKKLLMLTIVSYKRQFDIPYNQVGKELDQLIKTIEGKE